MYFIPKYEIFCDIKMDATSNMLSMHFYIIINITTYHKRYNLSLNTLCSFFFSKRNFNYICGKKIKRNHVPCVICYSYIHDGHRFLSTCNFTQ